MTEHRTITLEVFRTPQGEPTCCAKAKEQECALLDHIRFGTIAVCTMVRTFLHRGADGTGYLIPDCKCPLWHGVAVYPLGADDLECPQCHSTDTVRGEDDEQP